MNVPQGRFSPNELVAIEASLARSLDDPAAAKLVRDGLDTPDPEALHLGQTTLRNCAHRRWTNEDQQGKPEWELLQLGERVFVFINHGDHQNKPGVRFLNAWAFQEALEEIHEDYNGPDAGDEMRAEFREVKVPYPRPLAAIPAPNLSDIPEPVRELLEMSRQQLAWGKTAQTAEFYLLALKHGQNWAALADEISTLASQSAGAANQGANAVWNVHRKAREVRALAALTTAAPAASPEESVVEQEEVSLSM